MTGGLCSQVVKCWDGGTAQSSTRARTFDSTGMEFRIHKRYSLQMSQELKFSTKMHPFCKEFGKWNYLYFA